MSTKKKNKVGWYYCDVWQVNFYYFIKWDFSSVCSYVKKEFNLDFSFDGEIGTGRTLMSPNGCFIWIKEKKADVLVHESVHAAHWITARAGYSVDKYNDEAFAYLVANIFRQGFKHGATL